MALAAIQGLSQRLDEENTRLRKELAEKEDRIEVLEAENEHIKDRLAAIEEHVELDGSIDRPVAGD